jgi:hypothetical protein
MTTDQNATEILDRTYLDMRSRVLDLAAALDRIERTDDDDGAADDPRLAKLLAAIDLLNTPGFDRAERVQMIFSDQYESGWNQS